MKKIIYTLIFALFVSTASTAQGVAVNFSLINCNGDTTTLYPILDQGKVIILMYEHECGSCLTVALRIKNVINTYYSSNPNVQIMYLDNGGNNCATTANWISSNNLIQGISFKYSNDYNSPYGYGMPVIAIAGGSQHHLFLTTTDVASATETAIHNAIDNALLEIANSVPMISVPTNSFEVIPNPVRSNIILSYNSTKRQKITFELFDVEGKSTQIYDEIMVGFGKNEINLPLNSVSKGIYFIKATSSEGFVQKRILIEN